MFLRLGREGPQSYAKILPETDFCSILANNLI